jgi:hypothetical protein
MSSSVSRITAKGLNFVLILGAWTLWRHRNACLFDGASPNLSAALVIAGEELWFWRVAGASELSLLTDADQGGWALVGLFGHVVVALESVLVILSSVVSGLLPSCVLTFGAVCLCLLCVCGVFCFVFLCVCGVFCFVFLWLFILLCFPFY